MKVFIVMSGEDQEGGRVEGVYLEEEKAKKHKTQIEPTLSYIDWCEIEEWEVL